MSEQKVYDKAREMEREAHAVEEAEAFDEAADRASLEAVLDQDDARGIDSGEAGETEGLDPQGKSPARRARPEASAQPSLHIEPALGYAQRLAEAIWSKYYKADAPHWKPLDDVLGVLTQIDNMTSGLSRSPTTPTEGPAQTLTDEALYAVVPPSATEYMSQPPATPFSVEWQTGWNACRNATRIEIDHVIAKKVRASTLTDPEGAS